MRVLVTGGAGYIGSHVVLELLERGDAVSVIDDLSNGTQEALRRVERLTGSSVAFSRVDLRDLESVNRVFDQVEPDAVIHCAGLKAVADSVERPTDYYSVNIGSTIALLKAMSAHSVRRLVFSSSATVYGEPSRLPIRETDTVGSGITNPYGHSKRMIEQILEDVARADPLMTISILRYFNPIGAHESGMIGEDPKQVPNNLAPYIAQVAARRWPFVRVFGNDYGTPDGTGQRDYIHVSDLARGHAEALETATPGAEHFNLGSGQPTSVLDLIAAFERASNLTIPYQFEKRRVGDVAACYADVSKANRVLGWQAVHSVEDACIDAWRWQVNNPAGYESNWQ